MSDFQITEKPLSQIPALQLLIGLGFEFLTPAEAFRERHGPYRPPRRFESIFVDADELEKIFFSTVRSCNQ